MTRPDPESFLPLTAPEYHVLLALGDQALHGYVAQAIAACRIAGAKEANIGYKLPE